MEKLIGTGSKEFLGIVIGFIYGTFNWWLIKNYDVEPDNFIVSFIHKSLLESPDIFLVEIKIVLTSIVFSSAIVFDINVLLLLVRLL